MLGANRADSGGFGGKGTSIREKNRRVPTTQMGWGTSQNREGLVRGDNVTRMSLRKEGGRGEKQFYKHSVAESDSESTGYASISFSDSDTGSDDQEGGGGGGEEERDDITLVIGDEEKNEEEVRTRGDLEKELEGVEEGGERRQGGAEAGAAPGSFLTRVPSVRPLVTSAGVGKPLVEASVTKPQGHVGFSSLPDQVNTVMLSSRLVVLMLVLENCLKCSSHLITKNTLMVTFLL